MLKRFPAIARPFGRHRTALRLTLGAVLAGSCWIAPAAAHDLGPLGPALSQPLAKGWQMSDQDNLVILDNSDGSKSAQTFSYFAGPPPKPLRSSLLTFTIRSDDPNAAVALTMGGAEQGETCILEARASREAELNCISDLEVTQIGWVGDAVKLDGTDRLQIIEKNGEAIFLVNDTEMGKINNRVAMNGEMGVLASGRGLFGLSHFSTFVPDEAPANPPQGGTAGGTGASSGGSTGGGSTGGSSTGGERAPVTGSDVILAKSFAETPRRDGWTEGVSDGLFVTSNDSRTSDERLFPLDIPPRGPDGRVTEIKVGMIPPREGEQSPNAAAGLLWENRSTRNSCALEITAGHDALLICFDETGPSREMGRLKGVAKLDGSDTLAVIELDNVIGAYINGEPVGTLTDHPSRDGDLSLIAYERGTFGFTELNTGPIPKAGTPAGSGPAPSESAPETRRPAFSMGDDLVGPLPRFGDDDGRTIGAYIGIAQSILLHELGHALIGELELPSTGPEEDAVDIYSALQMVDALQFGSGDEEIDKMARYAATYGALSWYYSGKLAAEQGQPDTPWQDEHTADLKRFRNMFCVMYGAHPALFADLAANVGIDETTLQRCESEFQKQNRAWSSILAPYTRVSKFEPGGMLPADAPGAPVEVVFEPSKRQIGEFVRRGFGEAIKSRNSQFGNVYAFPRPLRITYRDCDQLNAWYAPREGEITMCYDIIEHFAVMISDIEMGTHQGYETPASAGAAPARGAESSPAPAGKAESRTASGAVVRLDAMDELAESGVPETPRLFSAPYKGPTPVSNPQARTITTLDLYELLKARDDVLILDVRTNAGKETLPLSEPIPGIGADGSLTDSMQSRVTAFLEDYAKGDRKRPLVVFGNGPEDRAAYNAALRIGAAGYEAYWYRGGIAAWTANDLPLDPTAE